MGIGPEVLNGLYNEASDVYSYGICLYEIASRQLPFQELVDKQVPAAQIAKRVQTEGLRPTMPAECPDAYRNLTELCWQQEHHARPTFTTICGELEAMTRDVKIMMMDGPSADDDPDLVSKYEQLKAENKELQKEVTELRRTVDDL